MSQEISRRKFLVISGGTLLMLTLGGCIKQEDNEEIKDGISQIESETGSGEIVENVQLQPTDDLAATEAITVEESVETPIPTIQNLSDDSLQPANRRKVATCPRGLFNDPYPGRCRHYIDSNGSGFCDYSEVSG